MPVDETLVLTILRSQYHRPMDSGTNHRLTISAMTKITRIGVMQAVPPTGSTALRDDSPRSADAPEPGFWKLVRRAMNYLDQDRAEAWRCLQDAYALLGEGHGVEPQDGPRRPAPLRRGGLAAWQVRRALRYVDDHLGAKVDIEGLCAAIGLSRSHFSRAFKIRLGASPMAYVAVRRIERAKALMVSSTQRLADVALVCGFSDQSHLNRHFRRVVGMSPGQWRRSSPEAPDGGDALGGSAVVPTLRRLSRPLPGLTAARPSSRGGISNTIV